jgi:predicted small metal-binding protein
VAVADHAKAGHGRRKGMLTIDDDMKETIREIANALQTVDLLSTRLR